MSWDMETAYMVSAGVGGAVLLLQMVLLVFGGDAEGDYDHAEAGMDSDDGSVGLLSVRTIASFLAFFGLTGWYGVEENWPAGIAAFAALAAGASMMFVVAWLMAQLYRLNSDGNLNLDNAVGKSATVYLKIPGERSGQGKITVSVQGRSMQFSALTSGPEIPTGAEVRVLRRTSEIVFEVAPVE